jgi:hypothetical protein
MRYGLQALMVTACSLLGYYFIIIRRAIGGDSATNGQQPLGVRDPNSPVPMALPVTNGIITTPSGASYSSFAQSQSAPIELLFPTARSPDVATDERAGDESDQENGEQEEGGDTEEGKRKRRKPRSRGKRKPKGAKVDSTIASPTPQSADSPPGEVADGDTNIAPTASDPEYVVVPPQEFRAPTTSQLPVHSPPPPVVAPSLEVSDVVLGKSPYFM